MCARSIVRDYARRTYPNATWVNFGAKYLEETGQWFAYAEHLPNTPGNYFVVYISEQGEILRVKGGL